MSTSVQANSDTSALAKRVTALDRAVRKLLTRFEQFVPTQGDLTITQWCRKRQISRAQYYELRKDGKTPRTLEVGGIVRITPEADAAWEAARKAEATNKETAI